MGVLQTYAEDEAVPERLAEAPAETAAPDAAPEAATLLDAWDAIAEAARRSQKDVHNNSWQDSPAAPIVDAAAALVALADEDTAAAVIKNHPD